MKNISLKAKTREKKVSAKEIRAKKKVPAVLYGKSIKNQTISIGQRMFNKIIEEVGTSSIFNLKIDNSKPIKVLIQDLQYNPVSDDIIHIDFYQIRKDEKIHTRIPVETTGKSLAVEEEGGNLIVDKDEIEIECLPDDLVENITIDISVLKTFDDVIRIKDLNVPQGITVLDEKDEVVATTTAPRTEEELEELEEAPTASDVDEIEVEAEKEDEEETEGEGEEKSKQEKTDKEAEKKDQ